MKSRILILALLSFHFMAAGQSNIYPSTGNPSIYDYSPGITLQRNTNLGGFTQGIQTKLSDGTNNWFYGALGQENFVVSKGDYSNPLFSISSNGNVGIGTTNPENTNGWNKVLDVHGEQHAKSIVSTNSVISGLFSHDLGYYGAPAGGLMGTFTNHPFSIITNQSSKLTILPNGNVGIGTTNPSEKLSVNGKIRAHEIKVEAANWPDYVFETDYKITSLAELEKFIKTNKHLPEMPSAKEVETNGIELGNIVKLQQQKIEELTLMLIEMKKSYDTQQAKMAYELKELSKAIKKI